jgi:hypothetical protein
MAEVKTKENNRSVDDFLNVIDNDQKRNDCFELLKIMTETTKEPPKMWGDSIVGFGSYHYKYDSGHEGDSCLTGFSPRKQNISVYIMKGFEKREELLQKLGKHKTGSACLYINKLGDVNTTVLKALIKESFDYMKKKYKS